MSHSTCCAPAGDDDRAFRATDCPNHGHCCDAMPDDPASWCDLCRWDYDCWLDRLAAEGEALRLAEEGHLGWSLEELMEASAN